MTAPQALAVTALVPPEAITFDASRDGQPQTVKLTARIATKTFDAIHRCLVFKAVFAGREAIVKIWEVSATPAGKEMLQMYANERDALDLMADTGFTPAVLFDGYHPAHHFQLEAKALVLEWWTGSRLRSCWAMLPSAQKDEVRAALLRFFTTSLVRGIYHDDLRHLRNTLWDEPSRTLTILDFELVGIRWAGSRESDVVEPLALKETDLILDGATQLAANGAQEEPDIS